MTLAGAVASFAVVAGLMTLTPGLDTALVLRTATRRGRRAAAAAALGISAGVLVWAVAAAVGVSALLTASATAYAVVRYGGAAYMLWLGVGMLRAAWRGESHQPDEATVRTGSTAWAAFRQGLLVNLMNPKVGAFYVALLPQFIPQGDSAGLVGALLGLVHTAEGMVWFALLILAVDRMRGWLARPAAQRWIDGVAGTAVVGFGLRLGLSRA
ncbi:LysE family translocator [Arsenicicoccus sp. oral taxon 190]|uniref:LysE family translocator n=1 Tax=Arsenicicoccus sp. oral taxon 190 TaxID=1658671 RepID=UPI00067A04CE|nr:LysE family translocator [Arsenicicoccus sp. oral taxon 190]AKT51202.1 lysine transporter LysE [Arsenicicoccus sp. oral taxon 190]